MFTMHMMRRRLCENFGGVRRVRPVLRLAPAGRVQRFVCGAFRERDVAGSRGGGQGLPQGHWMCDGTGFRQGTG